MSRLSIADLPDRYRRQIQAQMEREGLVPQITVPKPKTPRALQPLKGTSTPASMQVTDRELTLWVNYIVPSLNRILYRNRWVVAKEKDIAKAALAKALAGQKPAMFPGQVLVKIVLHRCRLIDADNAFCKAIVDQLRYAQVLKDDHPGAMILQVTQVKVPKKVLQGTAITICPVQ